MRRIAMSLAVTLALLAGAPGGVAAGGSGIRSGAFGVAGSGGAGATSAATMATVTPSVTTQPDGATVTTFTLPNGEVITDVTPPAGFDPLTASTSQLAEFGFPLAPTDAAGLQDWTSAMSSFRSDPAPTEPISVAVAGGMAFATYYTNWAGYVAGTLNTHNHTYVAVKGVFTVPSNSGTCDDSNMVGFWIGLGGWNNGADDLVQQGIECGDSAIGSGSAYRAFSEFASTLPPVLLCGVSSWTFPAGHVIYQNMSFQSSSNRAYFYLQDETSGVAHSCSATRPSGWSYNGDVADWIAEAPTYVAADFHSLHFTDANAELYSNSSWVTLGSQPYTKTIQGTSSSVYCIAPGGIGSDHASFTDTWHQANGS